MTMVGTWFGEFELLISENQTKMRFDFWNWFKNWKHSFWWMEWGASRLGTRFLVTFKCGTGTRTRIKLLEKRD
jgi:hypothetical protein